MLRRLGVGDDLGSYALHSSRLPDWDTDLRTGCQRDIWAVLLLFRDVCLLSSKTYADPEPLGEMWSGYSLVGWSCPWHLVSVVSLIRRVRSQHSQQAIAACAPATWLTLVLSSRLLRIYLFAQVYCT